MTFAPGFVFDEEKHEYWYKGSRLSGVTGLIAKKLGLKMPKEFVEEHQEEGIHVHKAIQKWIETENSESIHPSVLWLTREWGMLIALRLHAEVLVTDFKRYASAVDVVNELPDGSVEIFDIKKGVFKRDYVTWQLSIYKYLIERYGGGKVKQCTCICLKDREFYPVFPKPFEEVEKLLYTK